MVIFFKVKPAFLSDIQFYGQSSHKWRLENASNSNSKKTPQSNGSSDNSGVDSGGNSVADDSHNTDEDSTNSVKESGSNSEVSSSDGDADKDSSNSTEGSGDNNGENGSKVDSGSGESSSKSSSTNSKGSGNNGLETSDEEQQKFYCTLNQASIKPAILRIVLPFAESLVPKVTLPDYSKPITELYNPSALLLTYPELLTECERVYGLYKVC